MLKNFGKLSLIVPVVLAALFLISLKVAPINSAQGVARACPKGRDAESLSESFVGILCRNRPFSTELRQSVSTKIDDKVGNESFGTGSS
jgi:hypothetical protein